MVADLKAGTIDGYCVGEPWNLRASMEGIGFSIATDLEVLEAVMVDMSLQFGPLNPGEHEQKYS